MCARVSTHVCVYVCMRMHACFRACNHDPWHNQVAPFRKDIYKQHPRAQEHDLKKGPLEGKRLVCTVVALAELQLYAEKAIALSEEVPRLRVDMCADCVQTCVLCRLQRQGFEREPLMGKCEPP